MTDYPKVPEPIILKTHRKRHGKSGADEVSIDGLSGVPADVVAIADVDDEPVSGAKTSPISSNWASEAEEDLAVSKNLLKGLMNAICEDDFSWDEFDYDEVDTEDIEELVEEGLDRYLEREGGTLTGQVVLSGAGLVYVRIRPVLDQATLSGLGKPVVVYNGLMRGFTMPIYTGGNLAELYFTEPHVPNRWDGKSNPFVSISGYLDAANDNKRVRMQVCWSHTTSGVDIAPTTINCVEGEKLTGNWAQYQTYEGNFELDYGIDPSDIVKSGDILSLRIRRIDKTGTEDEIAGNVIITGVDIRYRLDKFYASA